MVWILPTGTSVFVPSVLFELIFLIQVKSKGFCLVAGGELTLCNDVLSRKRFWLLCLSTRGLSWEEAVTKEARLPACRNWHFQSQIFSKQAAVRHRYGATPQGSESLFWVRWDGTESASPMLTQCPQAIHIIPTQISHTLQPVPIKPDISLHHPKLP